MTRHTHPSKITLQKPVTRSKKVPPTHLDKGRQKTLPPQRGGEPKTVYLRKDADGWWVITCSYHRRFLRLLKREVPTRRWCHVDKTWRVPSNCYPLLRDVLDQCFSKIVIVRPKGEGTRPADPKVQYVAEDNRTKVAGGFDYGRCIDDEEEMEEVELGDLNGLESKVKVQGEE